MYDLIIIGAGPAGSAAAEAARAAGAEKVAVVEAAKRLGGECPNWGCIPTKSLLRSAEILRLARRAKEFGLRVPEADIDFDAAMRRKRLAVDRLTGRQRIENIFKQLDVDILRGAARFVGPDEIEIGRERHRAKSFIVASGSEQFVPPIAGLSAVGYLTSSDIMRMVRPPESVLIMGGGPIGCELADILDAMGTRVTIVEAAPHLLSREEPEMSLFVEAAFRREGIMVLTGTKVESVAQSGKSVIAETSVSGSGAIKKLKAATILVAVGKRPALAKLNLAAAGVELDERGRPKLNAFLGSTNEKIYFAGDAVGQLMYTNVAHEMGLIAAQNVIAGTGLKWDPERVVTRGTYCTPEVGSVGLTEREARERGYEVAVGTAPYGACGKSIATGESGLIKVIVDRKTGLILGGHIVGPAAAESVHELALAIHAKITAATAASMIYAFPTYTECVRAALMSIV